MDNQSVELVAYCGLYCGQCKKFLKDKCPGCKENEKASWCKTRNCCIEKEFASCADCSGVKELAECKKLNNFISKIFGFIFKSDRLACLNMIKKKGYNDFAEYMKGNNQMTIKK